MIASIMSYLIPINMSSLGFFFSFYEFTWAKLITYAKEQDLKDLL